MFDVVDLLDGAWMEQLYFKRAANLASFLGNLFSWLEAVNWDAGHGKLEAL